jgi:DnaJ-class molecular chaperone
MKVCRTCYGNKTISGMGHMKEKCKNCDGKGVVSETVRAKVDPVADPKDEPKKVKPSSSKKPKEREHEEKESGSHS